MLEVIPQILFVILCQLFAIDLLFSFIIKIIFMDYV